MEFVDLKMAERLLLLRKRHDLSQQEVADHLGISLGTYRHREGGRYPLTEDEQRRLESLYGVSLSTGELS